MAKVIQAEGKECDWNTIMKKLHWSPGLSTRIPDMTDVDVDDILMEFVATETLPQARRRVNNTRVESLRNLKNATLPNEIWRPVVGADDYRVSDLGRVWSLYRRDGLLKLNPVRSSRVYGRLPRKKNKQRLTVGINGRTQYVHRLVALAFIPNPDNPKEVDHINEDPKDNRAVNLRWVSSEENIANYMRNHGHQHRNDQKGVISPEQRRGTQKQPVPTNGTKIDAFR